MKCLQEDFKWVNIQVLPRVVFDLINDVIKATKKSLKSRTLNFKVDSKEKNSEIQSEPNCCAFCCKPTSSPDEMFCNQYCEWDYYEIPSTKRSAAIIKIAPNGDESYHL